MSDETTEMFPEQPEQPQQPEQPEALRSWAAGWHPINVLHLVFAVAFVGLVVNGALIESDTVSSHGLRWLLPIPWVAAGAAGLIASAPRLRTR
jgi:hypothetical protein